MADFQRNKLAVSINLLSTQTRLSSHIPAISALAATVLSGSAKASTHEIQADGAFTSISSIDSVHSISSLKRSGSNAVNVFDKFVVGSSHTVNLQVPADASKLVNIVRGSEAPAVHGILNSYKNGSLGGDVVFASSAGFVVGETGVVNVGSLSVKTPTQSEIDAMISSGNPVDAKITDLLNNSFSVSESGTVRIRGKINAASGVDIHANTIQIDSDGILIAGDTYEASGVNDYAAVNVDDLTIPTELQVSGGTIVLKAASTAEDAIDISGDMYADGGFIITADNISVNVGATLDTRDATASASSGSIQFNGDGNTATALNLNASDNKVLVDAATVTSPESNTSGISIIGGVTSDGSATITANRVQTNSGSSLDLEGSVTITADTQVSISGTVTAESGITINSKDIDLNSGSVLDTRNSDDSARGDITLNAKVDNAIGIGTVDSNTSIDISGQIHGGNITAYAESKASSSFYEDPGQAAGVMSTGLLAGATVFVMDATADATVNVNGTANIQASGNVSLASEAHAQADASTITLNGRTASLAAVYASSNASSTTHVKTGATIEAEGNLDVTAHNEAYLSASALDVVAEDSNKVTIAAALGMAEVNATAKIDSGVTLDADNLVVAAENQNYFYVSASAYGFKNTRYGIAVAAGEFDTSAQAELGSSIGDENDKVGNVSVIALDRTLNQRVHSGVTVGSNLLTRTVFSQGVAGLSAIQNGVNSQINKYLPIGETVPKDQNGKVSFKGGLAFSLNLSDHEAYSYFGVNKDNQASAPSVHATGNMLVASQTDLGSDDNSVAGGNNNGSLGGDQGGYRTSAEAAVSSPAKESDQTNQTDKALALALNFAINDSDAIAEIGDSVQIDALNLGVLSAQHMPIVSTYDKWETFNDIIGKFNGIGGMQNNILTSFANAGSSADAEAYGGSINVVWNDFDTKAWIGDNAKINTTGTGNWSATRTLKANSKVQGLLSASKIFSDIDYTFSFKDSVSVNAYNLMETVSLAGNLGSLGLLPDGNGNNKKGKSVGGSITFVQQAGQAVAGIGQSEVTATGNVGIYAETDERHFLVTPSSGQGKGTGVNGTIGILNSEVLTHASLSNLAGLTADNLVMIADHEFGNWAAAGAFNWSDQSAVGVAIAANISQGDTKAFIGDNSEEYNKVKFQDDNNENDPKPSPTSPGPTPTKGIVVNSVTVRGRATGTNGSLAVAGAATTEPSTEPGVGSKLESWYNGLSSKIAANYTGASGSDSSSSVGKASESGKNDSSGGQSGNSSAEVSKEQLGITGAGSVSVSVNNIDAKAIIDGATISGHDNGSGNDDVDVSVQALEKVISASATGSAALSLLGASSPTNQNTIAGAISYQISFNDSLAWIKNSVISHADDVSVQALHGGELTSVALALSVTRPDSSSGMTKNGALSVSGAQVFDGTSAKIVGSTITANQTTDNDLEVSAYTNTDIGVGGGTLYGGGKQGAGLAITFAEINDPSAIVGDANPDGNNSLSSAYNEDVYSGKATEAIIEEGSNRSSISHFDRVEVSARSLSRIGIGAAGIGYNDNLEDSLGFQGSFAIGSIGSDTKALIKGVNISGAGVVNVNASGENDGALNTILGDLGSSNTNQDFDFSGGEAIDNTNVHTSEDGSGSTYSYNSEGKRIVAVAGVVQIGKKNLGISYAHADVNSETKARIEDTNINQSDNMAAQVHVNARDNSLLYSVAIGVGVGTGGFSGVGSVAVNRLNNQVLAEIGDWNGSDKGTINASNLSVIAQNDMDMINVAGSVAVASGQGGATAGGLAVALNLVGTSEHSTKARISNTTLKVEDDLTVKAFSGTSNDHNLLIGNAIAIGANLGQSGLAFSGAITVNNIDQSIEAGIKDTGTNRSLEASSNDGGDILVKGQDYTDSVATAWMGAGSGQGSAVGVATATNRVDSDVTAEILGNNSSRGSTTLKAQNIYVDAHRRNWLLTIDAGVAASKQISFAPSIGTGVIDGNVTARIAQDAKVKAWNNVVVEASARSVNLVGSGALGIGIDGGAGALAVSTAVEYGKTKAYINDATIVAKGLGADYSANSGRLTSQTDMPDLSSAGEGTDDSVSIGDMTSGFAAHTMQEGTESASGLIVNATSYQKQRAITVGGSGSKNVALTANVSTTSVDSETSAYISNSNINKNETITSEADVLVRGSNHSFGLSVAAGGSVTVGGESGLAAIGGFSTNRDSKDTLAKIEDSTVNASSVKIDAQATKVAQAVSAGVAAALGSTSGIGGAASVVITEQDGNTTSWLRGGVVTADNLAVNAETRQEANVAAGAAGLGTSVGVGVGLAVNLVGGNTRARIGKDDGNNNDNVTTTVNVDDIDVNANRLESVRSYAFGAGIGASSTGVAAMVNTTEITGETRAGIYGKYNNSAYTTQVRAKDGTSKATSVDVSSQEILDAHHMTAGLGVGATVGVGAVASVLLGRSQAYSEVVGTDLKATTLNVNADTLRDASLISVSGAGGQYSAAVSIGLVLMGQGDSTTDDGVNAENEFGDSRSMANNALAEDYDSYNPHLDADDTTYLASDGSISQSSSSSDSSAAYTESGQRLKLAGESVTAARISGGIIHADTLNVNSDARLHTYQGVGAAQASAVGIAGGIGVTRLYDMSIATVDADVTADDITIGALIRNRDDENAAGEMKNFIIGVGGTAIGVSYSDVRSKNRVAAGLTQAVSSDTANDTGTLLISAKDTTELRIGDTDGDVSANPEQGTLNVNIGAGAVGVSVGVAEKDSDVDAWLGAYDNNNTSSTSDDVYTVVDGYSTQTVNAEVSGWVRSTAFAAAGGLLGGVQGVVTDARDKSNVDSVVYGQIGTGSGTLSVKATAVPQTFSRAYGVTVGGGAAVGGSFAYATADTTAKAKIADRTLLSENGRVVVDAFTGKADSQYVSADATAFSASGGLLAGVSGAEAVANNESDTIAEVSDYVQLPVGDLEVNASNYSRQISDADGYFVGYYSAGLTFSTAKSQTSTRVLFGKDPIGPALRAGDIILRANSVDENQGFSTAGGGGYVSGSATVSNAHTKDSNDKESASVEIADWSSDYTGAPVGAGNVQMEANHQTWFFAGADSINVAVFGGSGARSDVEVDLDTSVNLGKNVSFYADEIDLSTSNNVDQLSNVWNSGFKHSVNAGAGGALNGSAALSDIDVSHLGATIDLDENVVLKLDPLADLPDPTHDLNDYHIQMDAFTTFNINDQVVLEVGGALQGLGSESSVNMDTVNKINIGKGVQIINPVGQVEMGVYSRGYATADASSKVWAAAGIAGGVSDVDINTRNEINFDDNVDIESFQSTKILAGRSADYLTENYLSATARTNIYNWTLIPIPATKTADADVTVNSTVNFGNNVTVSSVRDILLEADRGEAFASGDGVERNPYLEMFSSETKFGSGNADYGSSTIIFDGTTTLEAGSRYQQSVTIDASGNITKGSGTEAVAYNYGSFSSRASLQAYIDELKAEKTALLNQTGGTDNNAGGINEDENGAQSGSGGSGSSDVALDAPARVTQIEEELAFLEPLLDTLPQNSNDAIYIGNLYAAGGDVSLKAGSVEVRSGSPSITAHGDPTITVTNNSSRSLILGDMYIPNVGGGSVLVSGAVSGNLPAGLAIVEENSGSGSHINIQHKPTVTNGADVVLQGDLINLGGVVTVNVEKGNLIQTGTVSAKQMALSVPSGVYLLNNAWGSQTYGFSPDSLTGFTSQWKPATPDQLVMYYVNAAYSSEMSSKGEESFNEWWYGNDYYGNSEHRDGDLRVYLNWGFYNDAECKGGNDCEIFDFDGNSSSRGSGNWGFEQIKNYQNNLVKTASYQQVKNAGHGDQGNGYALEAQIVAVNAYRIDINGTIRAGNFNEWSVEVGDNFDAAIASYVAAKGLSSGSIIKLSPGQSLSWQELNPNYDGFFDRRRYITKTVDPQISLVNGGDAGIGISYEVGSGKITLDDVNASGNGFVSLRGRLMSTGADGRILVDDGRGAIDVVNRSASELIINDLNAGSQSTGVIRITDLNYRDGNNRYFSEWYVHEPGQNIQKYVTSASATTYTGVNGSTVGGLNGGHQTYTYQPKKGQLYYFVQQEEVERSLTWTMDGEYISGWFSTYQPLGDWEWDADNPHKAEWNIAYSGYATCASVSAVSCNGDGSVSTYLTHILDDRYKSQTWLYPYTTSYSKYYGSDFTRIKWNIYVPTYIAMQSKTYVKADHPIKFQFIGADKGAIDIQSRTSVNMTGNINNSQGTTIINIDRNLGSKGVLSDDGDILMSQTGILNSEKAYLNAVGSIGSNLQALNLITDHISAVANNGSVNIDLTAASGDISVEKLHASSSLIVDVDKGLLPYGNGTHLKGDDIFITSEFGGVGDVDSNQVMKLNSTGLVTIKATDDIALNQASGDLTVNTLESEAGDIWITLGNGNLVNGIGQERYTDEELAYQADVWDRLNLKSDDAGAATVAAYENQVTGQYHGYWLIKQRLDNDQQGTFAINADYLDAFKTRYKAHQDALNGTDLDINTITTAEVTAALEQEYRAIENWVEQEKTAGKLAADYSLGTQFESNYRFAVATDSELYTTLTEGSRWSDSQLEISISAAALEPVTDGYISSRAANITGNNVRLNINNGRVGEDLDDMEFAISRTNPNLTDSQKSALLEAGPGDLVIAESTNSLDVSVKQQDPIKINADGEVTLIANGQIYVESDQGMTLKQISTPDDVRLAAGGSITSASGNSTTIAADNLNVSTRSGSIGSEANPIILDIESALRSVAAPSDIWLQHNGGNLQLGSIGAGGHLNLTANGNIENWSANGDNTHILANSASISGRAGNTKYNLGKSGRALKMRLTGGELKLEGANAWVEADSTSQVNLAAVNLNGNLDFDSASKVDLSGGINIAALDMDVEGDIEATETLSISGSGLVNILANTLDLQKASVTGSSVYLEADRGAAILNNVSSRSGTLSLLASGGMDIYGTISANKGLLQNAQNLTMYTGSAINGNGAVTMTNIGDMVLQGISSGGNLRLLGDNITINGDIQGKNQSVFDIDARSFLTIAAGQKLSTDGSMDIVADSMMMNAGAMLDSSGAISVTTANDAVLDRINSEQSVYVSAGRILSANNQIDAGTTASLNSQSVTVVYAAVTATDNLTLSSGGNITLLGDITSDQGSIILRGQRDLFASRRIHAGKQVDAEFDGTIRIDADQTLSASEQVKLKAAALEMRQGSVLDVVGDLQINTSGDQTLAQLDIEGSLDIDSTAGSVTFTELADITGSVDILADKTVTLAEQQSLKSDSTIKVASHSLELEESSLMDAGSALTLMNNTVEMDSGSLLKAAGNLSSTTDDRATLHQLQSNSDISVYSGGALLVNGSVSAGDSLSLESDNSLSLMASASAENNISIDSVRDTTLNGMVKSNAGSINFRGDDSLYINAGLEAATNIDIEAADEITLTNSQFFSAGQSASLDADNINFAENSELKTGAALTLSTGDSAELHTVTVGQNAEITTGTDFTSNGLLSVGGHLVANVDGDALFNDSVSAGNGISAVIGGKLEAGQSVESLNDMVWQVGDSATFNGIVNSSQGNIQLTGLDSLSLNDSVNAAKNITFTVAESLSLAATKTIRSGENTSLTAQEVEMGSSSRLETGNNLQIETQDDQLLATIIAGGDFNAASSEGAINFNEAVTVIGAMTVNADKEITLAAQQAINSGSLAIGALQAVGASSFAMGENASISTAGQTLIHTQGDQLLGQLTSNDADQAFYLKSVAGAINGRDDLDINDGERHLIVSQRNCDSAGLNCTGAETILQTATGIGDPLVVDLPWLSAETDDGDINIIASSDLHARLLRATNGNIYMTALGYLEIEELIGTPWLLANDFLFADRMTLDRGGISSRKSIRIDNITMTDTGPLAVYAPTINLTIDGGGAEETMMAMGGFNEVISDARNYYQNLESTGFVPFTDADDVVVDLYNSDQLHITNLLTKGGTMRMTGDLLVDAATVTTKEGYRWYLETNYGGDTALTMDLNNSNGRAVDVDGQFKTPNDKREGEFNGEFWMSVEGINVTTNAQFTRYRSPLLLTYKGQRNELDTATLPQSFYRLSAEYQNGINTRLATNNISIPEILNDEDEQQLVMVDDNWLPNLPATAAGEDNSEYWLITGQDDEDEDTSSKE